MYTHAPDLPKEKVEILQTGQWWVVELDEPNIVVQGESEEEALDKLSKRLEQYEERRNPDSEWANHSKNRDAQSGRADQVATTR